MRIRGNPASQPYRGTLTVPGGAAALIALGVLLGAAALWELAGARGDEVSTAFWSSAATLSGGRLRTLAEAALWLRIPERIERAGLATSVSIGAVLAGKLAAAALGAFLGVIAAPAAPGRLGIVVMLALPAAGFVAPEALLERAARRRASRLRAALPDALDLLAVGIAAGRSPQRVLGEISSAGTPGEPLVAELAVAVTEIECGTPQRDAVARLRDRVPGAGLGALAAALERSRRFGSPLADQLHEQAASMRRDARRRIEERAARAAPKIQLVVALVLVPSVLLVIVAGLVANSDALFGTL
jgi:tight adherence protein C